MTWITFNKLRTFFYNILIFFFTPAFAFAGWQTFHGNSQHNGLTGADGIDSPVIEWSFSGKDHIYSLQAPIVSDEGIIFTLRGTGDYLTNNDTIYAVSPKGKELWSFKAVDSKIRFTPLTLSGDGKTIYAVGSSRRIMRSETPDSYFYAVNSIDGSLKWKKFLSKEYTETWLSHIITDKEGRIIVHAGDLLAVFSEEGEKIWGYRFLYASKFGFAQHTSGPTLSIDNKTIYLLKRFKGGLMAFDSKTGKRRWHNKTGFHSDFGSPVVDIDGTVYVADGSNKTLNALKKNGKVKWQKDFKEHRLGNVNTAVSSGRAIYVAVEGLRNEIPGVLYALNKRDGSILWKYEGLDPSTLTGPPAIDKQGRIYLVTGGGYLYSISKEGKLLWKIFIGNKEYGKPLVYMSGPVLFKDKLYVVVGSLDFGASLLSIGSK